MKATYDQTVDALYIALTPHEIAKTLQINANVSIDLDSSGQVIGFEVLHARQSGVDPLTLSLSLDESADRPNPQAIAEGRKARMEALKRQRAEDQTVSDNSGTQ